jgi:hypothetical protein
VRDLDLGHIRMSPAAVGVGEYNHSPSVPGLEDLVQIEELRIEGQRMDCVEQEQSEDLSGTGV